MRHQQQRGAETFFLTGVDEHATKVFRVAQEQGLTPQEYVDSIAGSWRDLAPRLNAHPDFFIRTSDEGHKTFVREFLQRIYDNGDVYEGVYAGLYCVGCEEFKLEADLVDGKCPIHDTVPERIEEKNYFFRLSAYQDRLLALYDERPDFVLPQFRFNEARSFIAGGLQDFSHQPLGPALGHPAAVGREPGRLRLGRRAGQLPERAHLRAPGRGSCAEFLAGGAAPDGEGHPPLPLRLLAGNAARGRLRRAEADLRPRLPAARRPEDLEVARATSSTRST